jgi:transcriptional regulator GlxA family with amidase domain
MHTVAILALDQVVPFDMAAPMQVFDWTRLPDGRSPYRIRLCAETPEVRADGGFSLRVEHGLEALADADTVVVPGCSPAAGPTPAPVLEALRQAAAAGTRIASVCVGAFVLAEAGLLDGLRATTHWMAAEELARRFPDVRVEPDVLYVDNGQILTSAGAAAGLDMCLHIIRRDFGSAVAAHSARMSVMPLEREGGQAQFIVHDHPPVPRGSTLEPVLEWIEDNLAREITLGALASRSGMSERTFSRRPGCGAPSTCWRTATTRSNGSRSRRGSVHRPRSASGSAGWSAPVRRAIVRPSTGSRVPRRRASEPADLVPTRSHTANRPPRPAGSSTVDAVRPTPRSRASAFATASRMPVVAIMTQSV